jgi:chromosomal replication initiator protein
VKNVKRNFYRLHSKNSFRLFQLDLEILQSKTRKETCSQSKTIGYVFAKKFKASLQISVPRLATDHATVLHACKTVDNLVAENNSRNFEDIHKINAIKHHAINILMVCLGNICRSPLAE